MAKHCSTALVQQYTHNSSESKTTEQWEMELWPATWEWEMKLHDCYLPVYSDKPHYTLSISTLINFVAFVFVSCACNLHGYPEMQVFDKRRSQGNVTWINGSFSTYCNGFYHMYGYSRMSYCWYMYSTLYVNIISGQTCQNALQFLFHINIESVLRINH